MKIARATTEDINALADLAGAVEAMRDGNIPPEDGEDEWEYIGPLLTDLLRSDIPPSQQEEVINICRRCLLRLFEIANSGRLMRAATNLDAVFMPDNKIINLESSTLETHPSIDQGWADTGRLDWLIKTKHAILPGWCGDVYADSREEIDAAMNTPTSQQIEKEQS